ncbi:MAG: WXG100 family type VII secretion target [Peptococcaceae bacterium]|nr:WXG100 family type VII secretion target [Peptococcaceae bacterium]
MSQFTVTPEQLAKASKEISQLSETYTTIYKQLLQAATTMGAAWEGADNLAFVGQINGCCTDLQKMADKMRLASQALDKQQKNYFNRQQDNLNRIKNM